MSAGRVLRLLLVQALDECLLVASDSMDVILIDYITILKNGS